MSVFHRRLSIYSYIEDHRICIEIPHGSFFQTFSKTSNSREANADQVEFNLLLHVLHLTLHVLLLTSQYLYLVQQPAEVLLAHLGLLTFHY